METEEDSYDHEGFPLASCWMYYINGVGLSLALLAFGGLQGLSSGNPIPRLEAFRLLWRK